MGNLYVNAAGVEGDAAGIASAARQFAAESLSATDARTTLTANEKSKASFASLQNNHAALGAAISQEAANIRSLNVSFQQFDEMMGALAKNG